MSDEPQVEPHQCSRCGGAMGAHTAECEAHSLHRLVSCVLCDFKAVTTAAHIPVCENHWHEYATEAAQYLPEHKRTVRLKLLAAMEAANAEAQRSAPGGDLSTKGNDE